MGEDDSDDALQAGGEDRLPWLEAVEEEDAEGPSIAKLVAAIVIGLVAIGVIVGGLFWLGNRGQDATGEVIAAPQGDYKVRPADPGGMNVSGEGDVSAAASAGRQPQGNLNVNAVPEAPVTAAPRPATPAPAPAPAPPVAAPAPPAPPAPAPAPAAGGATIQLGAFSSGASANGAWTSLSGRFRYLAPLSHSVATAEVNGRTYYRLRASGPGASDVCRRLRAAGETCAIVN
ncbi:MAG: SPOR domain-containing protein [Alphaproteobacteria bacterium]|nr:MAG: SPOR domain-containing protein [Alphaproteobacteria bacterium]